MLKELQELSRLSQGSVQTWLYRDAGSVQASAAMEYWFASVPPGGQWDYKTQGGQYTAFGNFNFGATANVLGFGLAGAQRGAGAAAYATATLTAAEGGQWTAGPGTPLGAPGNDNGMPVYGDQARANENQSVIAGWGYAQWQRACGKL
jgi:hypothetical protein